MTLSVKPKVTTFAIGGPCLRTYHPYSDKSLSMDQARSDKVFNLKKELARNDRLKLKLRRARKVWR